MGDQQRKCCKPKFKTDQSHSWFVRIQVRPRIHPFCPNKGLSMSFSHLTKRHFFFRCPIFWWLLQIQGQFSFTFLNNYKILVDLTRPILYWYSAIIRTGIRPYASVFDWFMIFFGLTWNLFDPIRVKRNISFWGSRAIRTMTPWCFVNTRINTCLSGARTINSILPIFGCPTKCQKWHAPILSMSELISWWIMERWTFIILFIILSWTNFSNFSQWHFAF